MGSANSRFADRVPESVALHRSLEAHRAAMAASAIGPDVMNNLLVFTSPPGANRRFG